ncbi:multidrug ABC transporter permease [Gordonia rubripertincta]|uniref:ABC transporter permease n=1 Tax=Gordonia rubripertincta TaxID=36822 RepID=UPI00118113CC|nr:multidrug ABC transporter permease [Gordonia rubripertincta]TSD93727.1 multidrug ABC transporter permease [Gordonia rubripertincta]
MTGASTVGTRPLLKASLHHGGSTFAPWIVLPTALAVSSVLVYPWLFPDALERKAFATTVGANPALGLIFGPAYDLSTTDGFTAWRSLALGGFIAALGAIFIVVKGTRGQEDSGQAELLASGVLGRSARLLAALVMAMMCSLAIGVVAGVATGLCGGSWGSSMLLGAGFTVTGWMFAAVAVVSAQVGADARAATTISVSLLGVLFILRGFLYSVSAPSWTTWANPLGWIQETRPATGDHWWPLGLGVAFAIVVAGLGFALQVSRDFGQGLVPSRPGAPRGRTGTPTGLAVRLNRAPIASWSVAFVGLGVVFGYFTRSVKSLLETNPAMAAIFASGAASPNDLISAFVSTILSLVGIIASVAGVQIVNRVRTEELEDRTEAVLATSVARVRYLATNIVVAFVATAAFLLIAGTVVGVFASTAGIGITFGDALLQAVATIPATWTVIAFAVAVIGARPEARPAIWLGVLVSFVMTILGPSFKLPGWALGFSPFHHVPDVAAAGANWSGVLWIGLVTLGFLLIGSVGFRRRDIP